jgi:hypothetical protein
MRLDDFLDLLEERIRTTPKQFVADAILAAINDTRAKAEQDEADADAIWREVQSADMGQS